MLNKKTYILRGEALDQETIIRLRPWYEDYVREDMGKEFSRTDLIWEMTESGTFSFGLHFYV